MKVCSGVARSLNCTTCARSCGRSVFVKRIAASCAVLSFSSIEAEVSIISTIEIGRFSCVNRLSSWRMPSSKTAKSLCGEVGHEVVARVGDRQAQVDDLDPGAEDGPLLPRLAGGGAGQSQRGRERERHEPGAVMRGGRGPLALGAGVVPRL